MLRRNDSIRKAAEQLEQELAQRTQQAKREMATPEKRAVGRLRMDLIRECNRKLFEVRVLLLQEQSKRRNR